MAVGERPSFVTPEPATYPSSPAAGPRNFKIPSRPHTPVIESQRSPRLIASRPPSPPPPRRSAELRREREGKPPAPAPPVSRADKPMIPSRASYIADNNNPALDLRSRVVAEKTSPFNSPPRRPVAADEDEDDEDLPPVLPTRPRSQIHSQPPQQPLHRSVTLQVGGFEPPPVHHSVASKWKDRDDSNGVAAHGVKPHLTGETRPALPARPQITGDHQVTRNGTVSMLPPPRPPKPSVNTSNIDREPINMPPKRTASTPATNFPPPPTSSTRGRPSPVDKTSSRALVGAHTPQSAVSGPVDGGAGDPYKPQGATSRASAGPAFPDASNTNRRPPYIKQGVHEVATKYDSRIFDVCGELVCTSGPLTRVWSLLDGELLMSLAMGEGIRGSAVAFKPGANVSEEGSRIWIGNNMGEIMEADIATQSIVGTKTNAHSRHEVIKIYRHFNELWTLDDGGTLHVWAPTSDGTPNLANPPNQSFRMPKGHTFSLVAGHELWHATGKEIRVFLPTSDGRAQFQVLIRPLCQEGIGEVTSGTWLTSDPNKILFGHIDGKVSIYSRADFSCLDVVSVSTYKINTLASVGKQLWAGYNTGKICVYDMSQSPWAVEKDWQAHGNPVIKLTVDQSSFYKLDRHQIISLGADNMVRAWDGLLQEDWLENQIKGKDAEYCEFEKLKALIMTWNAGASTPNSLRYSDSDAGFIQNLLQSSGSPDILVFGFQELVDLEDKTATASKFPPCPWPISSDRGWIAY